MACGALDWDHSPHLNSVGSNSRRNWWRLARANIVCARARFCAPTGEAADSLLDQVSAAWAGGGSLLDQASATRAYADANDTLYQLDCSRTYNPEPDLERIQARLIAINAPDDFINPPELGIMDRTIKRVKNGRYVLLPLIGRGHSSVYDPSLWKNYLEELLQAPTH